MRNAQTAPFASGQRQGELNLIRGRAGYLTSGHDKRLQYIADTRNESSYVMRDAVGTAEVPFVKLSATAEGAVADAQAEVS